MSKLPVNPFEAIGIAEFGSRLRRGDVSAESATRQYLERIAILEPRIGAMTHVADELSMETARGLDRMLASGTDVGPLMGVPVVVKDLFSVDGFPPPRMGSNLNVSDLIPPEGEFIKRLRRAGCVVLGRTKMAEFAFGLANLVHKPPWNPWDAAIHRMPGGSSSGSAAALAAGMCAFAVGSDTGGSVRQPAALCGVFGFKPTVGLWPTEGVFPLSTTFDSIGTFTTSARDAALVFSVLTGRPIPQPCRLQGLRFGKPANHFFDALDPQVRKCTEDALEVLQKAGVELVPIEIPEASEVDSVFFPILPAELLAYLGADRVEAAKDILDPLVWNRIEKSFNYPAHKYIRVKNRHLALCRIAEERIHGLDAWVTPTSPDIAASVSDCDTLEKLGAWTRRGLHNTRPVNLFGQCGSSIPVPGASLPVGLQIICGAGREAELLSISQAIEVEIGQPARADLSKFS